MEWLQLGRTAKGLIIEYLRDSIIGVMNENVTTVRGILKGLDIITKDEV